MSNTDIPAAEAELDTKRQRLYHVTWLNRYRLDKQLRPLLRDLEQSPDSGRMGILFKATFRGAITLINHYMHFDIREHPSAIFLIMLKIIDDRSFDGIWNDYSPMIKWVNDDNQGKDTSSEVLTISNGKGNNVQLGSPSGLSNVDSGDERKWENDVQQDTPVKSGRKKTDSDTG